MKTILILIALVFATAAQALDRQSISELLEKKGVALVELERRGFQVLMGEVTGSTKGIPLAKVQAILTHDEAILRREIEGTEVRGSAVLGNLQSVRFGGQYVPASAIIGVIAAP